MKFKEILLQKIEVLNDNIEGLKRSIEKNALTKDQVYESYGKIQYELSQIETLINRE
jgi:hypothetical protein